LSGGPVHSSSPSFAIKQARASLMNAATPGWKDPASVVDE